MFKVIIYERDPVTYERKEAPNKSIIDNAWLIKTVCGYEVGINFTERWPNVDSTGSSSGWGDEPPEHSITFIHENDINIEHEIRWYVPKEFRDKQYMKLKQMDKRQCIVYFIECSLFHSDNRSIISYTNPKDALKDTFERFGVIND